MNNLFSKKWSTWFVYSLVSLAIMFPLLKPGYVFALDMVFGPNIKLPNDIVASYPFFLALKFFSFLLPVQIIQKALLFLVIVLCGYGAHKLTLYFHQKGEVAPGSYFAGIFYAMNPFTYARFMDGQYTVLLGYALLPFFALALLKMIFDKDYSKHSVFRLSLITLLISIISIHAVGYMVVFIFAAIVVRVRQVRPGIAQLKKLLKPLGMAFVIVLIVSSYWTIPIFTSNTPREQLVSNFDNRYLLSFRTDGTNGISVVTNVLSLNGYWGDREGRYILQRQASPIWFLLAITMISLTGYGFYLSRSNPRARALLLSAIIGLVLAVGIAAPPFSSFNQFLYNHLPFYRAFREPQKFVSLIALFYAVMGGAGLNYLLKNKKLKNQTSKTWLVTLALLLPVVYTPTFIWGFNGQLKSSQYPKDWAEVNNQYIKKAKGSVLFLPWHQYMYFGFAGRVISNPGPIYFDGNVIAGDNAQIGLLETQLANIRSDRIAKALASKSPAEIQKVLKNYDIQYILLSKNVDWRNYSFLDNQSQLIKSKETSTLKLFTNSTYAK